MKTKTLLGKEARWTITFVLMMIMILPPVHLFSQDTDGKPDQKKHIKLYVKVDKDGKSKVLDTTFSITGTVDEASMNKLMKDFDINVKDLSDKMKEIEVTVNDGEAPDSANIDSVVRVAKNFRMFGNEGRGHKGSHGWNYDYNFEIPRMPEMPTDEFFDSHQAPEAWVRKFEQRGNTLSDILGDIPMERVKKYSIKDTRDGKKITIELKNGPLFEHRDKVIVIRDGGERETPGPQGKHQMRKRVIIKSGDAGSDDDAPTM